MSNEFDPLSGYDPEDIPVEDILAVSVSDQRKQELLEAIVEQMGSAQSVKEVLAVLSNVGQLAIKVGLNAAKGMA